MAYDAVRSDRPSDDQLSQPLVSTPLTNTGVSAGDSATANGEREKDAHGILWSALHERLGNRFAALTLGAGPSDSFELLMMQILEVSAQTGLDMTPTLPWNAPLTWNERVAGLAERLWSVWPQQVAAEPGLMAGAVDVDTLALDSAFSGDIGGAPLGGAFGADLGGASLGGDSDGGLDAISPMSVGEGAAMVSRDAVPGAIEGRIDHILRTAGAGQPLSDSEQSMIEAVHGKRMPEIRVHRGSKAAEAGRLIAARAFTLGNDIFLGENGGSTDTPAGVELLVHESTHVLQAQEGRLPAPRGDGMEVSSPSQPHEREAEAIGREARQSFVAGDLLDAPAEEEEQSVAPLAQRANAAQSASDADPAAPLADVSDADLAAGSPDDAAAFDSALAEVSPLGEAGDALVGHLEGQIESLGAGAADGAVLSRFAGLGNVRSMVSSAVEDVSRRAIRQNTTEGEAKDVSMAPQKGNAPEERKSSEADEVRGTPLEDALKRTREKLGQGLFDSALEAENGFARVEHMQERLGHDMLGHLTGGNEGNPDRFMAQAEEIAGLNDVARDAVDGLIQPGGIDVDQALNLSRVLPGPQLEGLMESGDKAATERMVEVAENLGDQAEATLTAFTEGLGDNADQVLHELLAGEGNLGAEDLRVMRDQGIKPTLLAQLSEGLSGQEITDAVATLGSEVVKDMGAELGPDALSSLAQSALDEGQINDLRSSISPEKLRTLIDRGMSPETIAHLTDQVPANAMDKLANRLPGPTRPPGSESQQGPGGRRGGSSSNASPARPAAPPAQQPQQQPQKKSNASNARRRKSGGRKRGKSGGRGGRR